jgi:hypothetical protein
MSYPHFDYSIAKQNDRVVVLGGGPTAGTRLDVVSEYIERYKPIVLSANYDHDVPIDYIVSNSKLALSKLAENPPKCKKLIIRNRVGLLRLFEKTWADIKGYRFYVYCDGRYSEGAYKTRHIKISEQGRFLHYRVGSSGFGALALSVVFRPKEILIVGFDGPLDNSFHSKKTYRGNTVPFLSDRNKYKGEMERDYLHEATFPFIRERVEKLMAFPEDALWGADRTRLGITDFTF